MVGAQCGKKNRGGIILNEDYEIQSIEKCCSTCKHSEDDFLTCEIGYEFICPYQPKKVFWNGVCKKYEWTSD